MSFALSTSVDSSKVFIERKTNVTNRWDPFYYRPDLVTLEKKVGEVTTQRLRDFALSFAGGATPSTKDAAEHYDTTPEDGVPFIRVQNLSTTGELNLEDIKLITRSTHEGLLKRSRLEGGELLVKITGVGRMAVASVVPEGFEGTINQHMVAIRTGSIETSRTLAAYLNLDISERLASRRATGGTRPALDYPALLSIPIVFDERIPKMLQKALDDHREKLSKAKALLASIDDLLLAELGIPNPPEPPNTLESRMFQRQFSEVSGQRFDPFYHRGSFKYEGGVFPNHFLRELASLKKGQSITSDRVTHGRFPVIAGGQSSPFSHSVFNEESDVITVSASGAYAGFVWYHDYPIFASDCTVIRSLDNYRTPTAFLYEIIRLKQKEIYSLQTGSGQPHVYPDDLARIKIPRPPTEIQIMLLDKIGVIRNEAALLRAQAQASLEQAKRDIEAMILGQPTDAV